MTQHALLFNVCTGQFNRPGGAHRLASMLREQDWDVEVCDYADEWQLDELKEFCKSRINFKTVFIGFSCFFDHWSGRIENLVLWLKEVYPDLKLIRGGQVVPKTIYPSFKIIDYHVAGYGEQVILEIIKKITGSAPATLPYDPYHLFEGIKLIDSNNFFPAWPLTNPNIIYEARDFIESWEWLTTEFSRGCKFNCPYCNFPVTGVKGDYSRDAESFDRQLRHAYDHWGVTNYYCADETFNDKTEKIIKFADVAQKFNFIPFFSAFVRADLIAARPHDWEHFLRLGVLGHFYGVETFNYESAKFIGKGMRFEKITQGLLDSKNYWFKNAQGRYRGSIALIVGLPHETKISLENTFEWIRTYWNDQSYMAWPLEISKNIRVDRSSEISKNYSKYGYTISDDPLSGYQDCLVKNNSHLINWKNENFSFNEALSIADNFEKEKLNPSSNYKLGAFELAQMSMYGDIYAILTYKFSDAKILSDQILSLRKKFLQRYINKKLSI